MTTIETCTPVVVEQSWDEVCFPTPVRPPRVVSAFDCACDSVAFQFGTCEVQNPHPWAPITLQVQVRAGAVPVKNWRIRAYDLPPSQGCPSTAADVAFVEALYTPVWSLVMPSLPAGANVILDGVREQYDLVTNGRVYDARRFVFSEGGRPFRLPQVAPCARLCMVVLANACTGDNAGAQWSVSGMAAVTIAGGGGGTVACS